jgi:hypothetical protein
MNAWEVVNGDPASGEFLVAWQTDTGQGPLVRLRRYSPRGRGLGVTELAHERGLRLWRLVANHHGDLAFLRVDMSGGVLVRLLDAEGNAHDEFVVTSLSDIPWIGDLAYSDTGKIFAVWISPIEDTTAGGATFKPVLGRLWAVGD